MIKWIDVSQPLRMGIPVWPGDTEYSFTLSCTKQESGSVNVGQLTMSSHTGTHIDAPYHFDEQARKIHELDLSLFVGPAFVIHLPFLESIGASELEDRELVGVKRLLIRTDSWTDYSQFPEKPTYVRPDIVPVLKKMGIQLLGLDVPSVDPIDSKSLETHHSLNQGEIHILEGLVLSHICEGKYVLIALPLCIEGGDGSPVRAVLGKENE